MKKVFFSAVALVAFSFVGMANEIEEKKAVQINPENNSVQIEDEEKSCGQIYLEDFERYESIGLTFEAASDFAFHNYKKCTGTL